MLKFLGLIIVGRGWSCDRNPTARFGRNLTTKFGRNPTTILVGIRPRFWSFSDRGFLIFLILDFKTWKNLWSESDQKMWSESDHDFGRKTAAQWKTLPKRVSGENRSTPFWWPLFDHSFLAGFEFRIQIWPVSDSVCGLGWQRGAGGAAGL